MGYIVFTPGETEFQCILVLSVYLTQLKVAGEKKISVNVLPRSDWFVGVPVGSCPH